MKIRVDGNHTAYRSAESANFQRRKTLSRRVLYCGQVEGGATPNDSASGIGVPL